MLFAGFNVSEGKYTLLEAVVVGSVANLVGSWIAYAVGYYGRIELLEKHGRKLHIKPSHLQWADRWFEKYGSFAVFFSRMLPSSGRSSRCPPASPGCRSGSSPR